MKKSNIYDSQFWENEILSILHGTNYDRSLEEVGPCEYLNRLIPENSSQESLENLKAAILKLSEISFKPEDISKNYEKLLIYLDLFSYFCLDNQLILNRINYFLTYTTSFLSKATHEENPKYYAFLNNIIAILKYHFEGKKYNVFLANSPLNKFLDTIFEFIQTNKIPKDTYVNIIDTLIIFEYSKIFSKIFGVKIVNDELIDPILDNPESFSNIIYRIAHSKDLEVYKPLIMNITFNEEKTEFFINKFNKVNLIIGKTSKDKSFIITSPRKIHLKITNLKKNSIEIEISKTLVINWQLLKKIVASLIILGGIYYFIIYEPAIKNEVSDNNSTNSRITESNPSKIDSRDSTFSKKEDRYINQKNQNDNSGHIASNLKKDSLLFKNVALLITNEGLSANSSPDSTVVLGYSIKVYKDSTRWNGDLVGKYSFDNKTKTFYLEIKSEEYEFLTLVNSKEVSQIKFANQKYYLIVGEREKYKLNDRKIFKIR